MDVLHIPEVFPWDVDIPCAVQRSGDDYLYASWRIVPGCSMGSCRSAAGLDAGIHRRLPMTRSFSRSIPSGS